MWFLLEPNVFRGGSQYDGNDYSNNDLTLPHMTTTTTTKQRARESKARLIFTAFGREKQLIKDQCNVACWTSSPTSLLCSQEIALNASYSTDNIGKQLVCKPFCLVFPLFSVLIN